MGNIRRRRELVALFMESPFYFDLGPRDRLLLVQHHENRFPTGECRKSARPFLEVVCRHREKGAASDTLILIPVGFLPGPVIPPAPEANNPPFPATTP